MSCKTCDHTMQRIAENPVVFWCPRCGTIKMQDSVPEFEEPKIVHRAFNLCEAALGTFDDPKAVEIAERAVRECVESNASGV